MDFPATCLQRSCDPCRLSRCSGLDFPLVVPDTLGLSKISRSKCRIEARAQDTTGLPPDEDERLPQLSPHRPNKQKNVRRAMNQPIPNASPPSVYPSQELLVKPSSDRHPAPLSVLSCLLPIRLPAHYLYPELAKKRRHGADADDVENSPLDLSKKRKCQRVVMDEEDDDEAHLPPPWAIPTVDRPPSPSNSLVSSSPPLPSPPTPVIQGESRKQKHGKGKQVNDDTPPRRFLF